MKPNGWVKLAGLILLLMTHAGIIGNIVGKLSAKQDSMEKTLNRLDHKLDRHLEGKHKE
jgi:hypothetical protein